MITFVSWFGTVVSILGSFAVASAMFKIGYVLFTFGSLAWLIVACDPKVVLNKYLAFVPDVANDPTVLVVPAFSFNVPLVIASVLVKVKASCISHVPPTPLKLKLPP